MTSQFPEEVAVPLASHSEVSGLLFEAHDAVQAESEVIRALEALPEGGVVVVDFSGVRVSSEAGRQVLARALRRLRSGEIPDRYIVLSGLGSSRYNVEVMLQGEGLVTVERAVEPPESRLVGRVEPSVAQTFTALAARGIATASEVRADLKLNSTQAATNRLAALVKSALARRVAEQPLEGGGREYVYAALQ